jgi:hypothetical protein
LDSRGGANKQKMREQDTNAATTNFPSSSLQPPPPPGLAKSKGGFAKLCIKF